MWGLFVSIFWVTRRPTVRGYYKVLGLRVFWSSGLRARVQRSRCRILYVFRRRINPETTTVGSYSGPNSGVWRLMV